MSRLFFNLYLICRKRPLGVFFVVIAVLSLSVLSISNLKFSENILDLIPGNQKLDEVSSTLESLEINNQITLHFHTADSSKAVPDRIIEAGGYVKSELENKLPHLIKQVRLKIDNSQLDSAYSQIYKYLPYYLTSEDYESIAKSVTPEGIERAMAGAFKSLNSPMGSFSSNYILKDPLGMTFLPLNRFRELSRSGEIELYKDHLLTGDKRNMLAFAILQLPSSETLSNQELIDFLDDLSANVATQYPEIRLSYFGSAAVAVANARQIRLDIFLTIGLASVFLLLLILAYFRRLQIIFLVLLPGIFGAILSGGLLSLFNQSVSTIALATGSVLLGITIDYALHFLAHAKNTRSVKALYADLTTPVLICAITTASAFFSLMVLGTPALADLGLFAGFSVLFAAIGTLMFLPLLTAKMNFNSDENKVSIVEKWFTKIAEKAWHRSKAVWIFIIGISVMSCFTWQNYRFETDMLNLSFMPPHLAKAQTELNSIADYSKNTVYMASRGRDIDSALEENRDVDSILHQLETDGLISSYFSFNALIPSPSERKAKLQEWNSFWDEVDRDQVIRNIDSTASAYGFNSAAFQEAFSLIEKRELDPKPEDLKAIVNLIGGGILLNNSDPNSVAVLSFAKVADSDKMAFLSALQQKESLLILDQAHITTQLITQLRDQFSKLVNISMIVVFMFLLLSYGRIELAFLAFFPTALSWFWILGIMGVFNLSFNIINVIISTFIFGLGIDYSVFQLRGLLQGYASAKAYVASYRKSILLSLVTTLLSIGVLIFAKHPSLKSIAALAIIGMGSVVVITFVIQPFLFNLLIGNRKKKGVIPYTFLSLIRSATAFGIFLIGCLLLNICRLILLVPVFNKKRKKLLFHRLLQLFCRLLIVVMIPKIITRNREYTNFDSPSVIIANHHSFIDILYVISLHKKIVIVTNDWVYNSPFFGSIVRYADFVQASQGIETQLEKIQSLVHEGFSIAVFPEGTRSETNQLARFHKGAFYLAENFNLDIQPLIIHGTAKLMPKGDDFNLKSNNLTGVFLPRISHDDPAYGAGYRERSKIISTYFKSEYYKLVDELEDPKYFAEIITANYIYKGPVLEYYMRVKMHLEEYYVLFDKILPDAGKIVDLGCGYGFMTQTLAFAGPMRNLIGMDYDSSKIEIAQNVPHKPQNLTFKCADVMEFNESEAQAFIVSDVLHYLKPEEQNQLLQKMVQNLLPNGVILIRDGDASLQKRHRGSVLTEIFSTKSGFNKTRNDLNFITTDFIRDFASKEGLNLEIVDNTKRTSNIIYILRN